MDTKNNEQERAKYTRLISEKEATIDELKVDKRKLEDNLLHLQTDLQRGYRQLSMLDEEDLHSGDKENLRIQRQNEAQEYFFKRELRQAEEQLSESYRSQEKIEEDEKEKLYEQRSAVPWN